MNVDRLARHAQLYGCEGIFPAAAASVKGAELVRLAAILSVAEAEPDLWGESAGDGARGACGSCGRPFEAKRSTARYCGPTCRSRAHRGGSS